MDFIVVIFMFEYKFLHMQKEIYIYDGKIEKQIFSVFYLITYLEKYTNESNYESMIESR